MSCPPTKRLRGQNQDVVTAVAFNDTFGDDDEFTQADLDEIDIIASQAITSAGPETKPVTKPSQPAHESHRAVSAGPSKPLSRAEPSQTRESTFGVKRGNAGLGNLQQKFGSDGEDSFRLLEAQYAELKKKLMEVEEEILLKSGEIRVLRDSLKAAQQEKEAQRQTQVLRETQRQKEQSEKEKELNRKVQSLQSELQFKEAEIIDMKTKLLNSDKTKMPSPVARNSPNVLSTLAQVHHGSGSSSSSPVGNGFITKETFGGQISSRTTPMKTPLKARRDADRGASSSRSGEGSDPDPFLAVCPAHLQAEHRGGVLLGLLLQQPLSPYSLGLTHLLSMSGTNYSQLCTGLQLHSDPSDGASPVGDPRATLSLVQSLAATGLNMLSQSRATTAGSSRNIRSCSGAVLLLPLLDLLLSQLCRALDSLRSSSTGSGGSDSTAPTSLPSDQTVSGSPGLERWEQTGLTALWLLYVLLAHSDEVVMAVLSQENQSTDKTNQPSAHMGPCSQNALLQSLLRLCDMRLCGSSSQKEALICNALKTLCVLIKRTPHTHSDRLQCVLQAVVLCLSSDIPAQALSEWVSVLAAVTDHQKLAEQLCSQHDPCVFLKLFQFIRTPPDNQPAHTDLILLHLQVVHLLNRLTQSTNSWTNSVQNTCQCYAELVQTTVIILHRQWLELRGSQEPAESAGLVLEQNSSSCTPWWSSHAASLLRECLLLLHWLLLHHGSFSESCRPLLHMYDQVIPAVRETLRKIPELSESEVLALEEICRSEGDDTDMDTDVDS
ncbi:ATR-interacting protein [Nematolebias whitei]|uniref:ATR-interacting protein n=1 Tax=Nematolebias whitei TaxID=451745 RepID=UPI0018970377|nr:ATR-interacting protein [Nematolebias whitei]